MGHVDVFLNDILLTPTAERSEIRVLEFILGDWLGARCPAGADTPSTEDTVSLAFLLPVRSALLAEDDVAVPRLAVRVPLLPAERFLPPEAFPPVSRCCRPAAGAACGGLAGACGGAPVREQTAAERLRRPALHGEFLTSCLPHR